MSEELLAEVFGQVGHDGIIFSQSDLRYHRSGGHPSTAGPDYNLDARPLCSWQLPLSIWLERYGATIHWPPVISVRSRVSRFISRDAHSLLHTRAALCEIHQAPALLLRFGHADWDRYLAPVLIAATQPIDGLNVLSKGLAGDKRRQKYAGLRLRRLSGKGAFSRRNRSYFTWAGHRRARRGLNARETRGRGVPQQSNIRDDSCSIRRLRLEAWAWNMFRHLEHFLLCGASGDPRR